MRANEMRAIRITVLIGLLLFAGAALAAHHVNGNEVEFSFTSDQAGKVSYKGTVDGDTMEGTCTYGDLGSGTFKGKKKSES